AGQAVDPVVQQIDVMPTILRLLGWPIPDRVEGTSVMPLIGDPDAGTDRYAVTELGDRSIVSIITADWRLLKNTQDGAVERYRTVEDPDGLRDLSDSEPEVVAELDKLLDSWRAAHR